MVTYWVLDLPSIKGFSCNLNFSVFIHLCNSSTTLNFLISINIASNNNNSQLRLLQEFECNAEDLKELKELGHGAYGYVYKMIHQPTGHIMAVKVNFKQIGGCQFSL